jgi:hypothetical protein
LTPNLTSHRISEIALNCHIESGAFFAANNFSKPNKQFRSKPFAGSQQFLCLVDPEPRLLDEKSLLTYENSHHFADTTYFFGAK